MSLLNLFGNAKAAQAPAVMAEMLKRGKSPDQCKCIDFFVGMEGNGNSKGGCLKPKEWTIDDYCAHVQRMVDELNLKQRAMTKIGLDESQISEIRPICLSSFLRGSDLYVKTSEDYSKYVTNKYSVTWIFFSAQQIYTYTYTFETTGDNVTELTRDFFYTDITCIRTEHEIEEVIHSSLSTSGCGCMKKEEMKHTHHNRHWDTLQITVPNDTYSFCCRTTSGIEDSIQAAKAMIREKKYN